MGLDIWFKEDIANILRAVDEANLSALGAQSPDVQRLGEEGPAVSEAYREGFAAALLTVAVALGLPLSALGGAGRPSVGHIRDVTRTLTLRPIARRRR